MWHSQSKNATTTTFVHPQLCPCWIYQNFYRGLILWTLSGRFFWSLCKISTKSIEVELSTGKVISSSCIFALSVSCVTKDETNIINIHFAVQDMFQSSNVLTNWLIHSYLILDLLLYSCNFCISAFLIFSSLPLSFQDIFPDFGALSGP